MNNVATLDIIRKHYRFSGWVQGVGFRFEATHQAKRLKLVGWIRNLPDGDVEAELEGSGEHLDSFIQAIRSVLRFHLTDIQEYEMPARMDEIDFRVIY